MADASPMAKPKRKTRLTKRDVQVVDEHLELIGTLVQTYAAQGTNLAVWAAIENTASFIEDRYSFGNTEGTSEIKRYAAKLFGNAESDGHEVSWASWIYGGITKVKYDIERFRTKFD